MGTIKKTPGPKFLLPLSHRPSLNPLSVPSPATTSVLPPYPFNTPEHPKSIKIVDVRKPHVTSLSLLDSRGGPLSHLFRFALTFLVMLHQNVHVSNTLLDHSPPPLASPLSSASSTISDSSTLSTPSPPSSPRVIIGPIDDAPSLQDSIALIADSIRQQRYTTCRYLLLHPTNLFALLLLFILLLCFPVSPLVLNYFGNPALFHVFLCAATASLTYFTALYFLCATYELHALAFHKTPDILRPPSPHPNHRFARQDIVVSVRRGSELLSTAIVRIYPSTSTPGSRRRKNPPGAAVLRAWTTHKSMRMQGFGYLVLRAAVKEARAYCGRDVQVTLSQQHANSREVPFGWARELNQHNMQVARMVLNSVMEGFDTPRKKR